MEEKKLRMKPALKQQMNAGKEGGGVVVGELFVFRGI